MTEETAQQEVERLDFSRPPPGYVTWYDDQWQCDCFALEADGRSLNPEPLADDDAALAAAWAHYKERHDPPGIDVARAHGHPIPWWAYRERLCLLGRETKDEARAAAWAWYERRLALYDEAAQVVDHEIWPAILTCTDEQARAAENWLHASRLAIPVPEVLRR